jgi:hypothetical protein
LKKKLFTMKRFSLSDYPRVRVMDSKHTDVQSLIRQNCTPTRISIQCFAYRLNLMIGSL